MPVQSTATTLRTLDGLQVAGTLVTPAAAPGRAVVLVHGGRVTREIEGLAWRPIQLGRNAPERATTAS